MSAPIHFLDLPFSIRTQIYTSLLVPNITLNTSSHYTYTPTTLSLLRVSRAIYAEASAVFYSQNLFIAIQSNTPKIFAHLHAQNTPIFARVAQHERIARCARFAMHVELRSVKMLAPIEREGVTYVITAEALCLFFAALVGKTTSGSSDEERRYEHGNFTCVGVVGVFRTPSSSPSSLLSSLSMWYPPFRYTPSRFSQLTFGRLATLSNTPDYPRFSALRIESEFIAPAHGEALMVWCGTQTFHDPLEKKYFRDVIGRVVRSWHLVGSTNTPRTDLSEREIGAVFDRVLDTVEIYWECLDTRIQQQQHQEGRGGGGFDVEEGLLEDLFERRRLYGLVLELCNSLMRQVFNIAKRSSDGAQARACFVQARRMAETGIRYLNRDHTTNGDEGDIFMAPHTHLSLRAARACKKIGDFAAAQVYLDNARTVSNGTPLADLVLEKEIDFREFVGAHQKSVVRGGEVALPLSERPLRDDEKKKTDVVLLRRRKVADMALDAATYRASLMILENQGRMAMMRCRMPL